MTLKQNLIAIRVFIAAWFIKSSIAFAGPCAMCKMGLEQDGSSKLTLGFYISILLIVSIPLIIIFLAGIYFYKVTKSRLSVHHDTHSVAS